MRFLMGLFAAGVFSLAFGATAKAQNQPTTCADWFAVQSWTGTVTYTGSGSGTDEHGNTQEISERATIEFTTEKSPTPCDVNGNFSVGSVLNGWSSVAAKTTFHIDVNDTFTSQQSDSKGGRCTATTNVHVTNGTYNNPSAQVNMHFANATSGTHTVIGLQRVDGVTEDSSGCGNSSSQIVDGWLWGPASYPDTGVALTGAVGPITGNQSFTNPAGTSGSVRWTISWTITPNINYDVYLQTSPDYADWRPAAGASETDPSEGILGVNVFVVDKDTGKSVANLAVDGWKLELKDVSHEPGVSMNYPAKKKLVTPTPPDLDFKDLNGGIFPNVTVSDDGLTLTATPDNSTDNQLAFFINSRDWGGWGTLNITTTIAGKEFKAHFPDDEETDILLPKRQKGSFIADSWKTAHNIALDTPDSDDSETDPVGAPGCTGDGLTLYEEYRGFMEKGKHIEGDVQKKDFFVQNIGGGDMKPGIRKFAAITGLVVHKDIQKDEMEGVINNGQSVGDRLINFNHSQGAHEVDQHGVLLAVCSNTNGGATFIAEGVHGRPGLTNGICMETKGGGDFFDPHSLGAGNTHGGAITVTSAAKQYDIAVAHELAHSVGVDHHGEGDQGGTRFTLMGPNDPRNTSGAPAFLMEGQAGTVHLLRETGQDIAPPMWDILSKRMVNVCGTVGALYGAQLFTGNCQAFVNGAVPIFTDVAFYVGRPQRQHSGNDQCIMRYFFANAYPKNGDGSTYYLSTAGTEPVGSTLCTSPAGTGVNGPGFKPQSRYGNAADGRGACRSWVCVNDKYAPVAD